MKFLDHVGIKDLQLNSSCLRIIFQIIINFKSTTEIDKNNQSRLIELKFTGLTKFNISLPLLKISFNSGVNPTLTMLFKIYLTKLF